MAATKKATPKASTKKGKPTTAPKAVSPDRIPAGATVIPDHKYDEVVGYLEGSFPEIGNHDQPLNLLLSFLEATMPGPNLRYSYGKARETFKETMKAFLVPWKLTGMPEEDREGYNDFLVSGLKDLLDNVCGYVSPRYSTIDGWMDAARAAAATVPIPQRSDAELIKLFVEEPRDEDVIAELEKRSKGSFFLAYAGLDGTPSSCDQALSVDLLKRVRKGEQVPRRIYDRSVLRVSEVDVKNRIRRECPLCPGAALVQGTCPVCNNDFSTVHLSYQKKMRIAAEAMGYANLKLLIAGTLAALGKTLRDQEGLNAVGRVIDGPTVIPEFNRLVATDSLPTLVLVDRPAVFDDPKELRRVDAFHRNLGGK